jgi:uncharacterized protein Yka (UPF0111/DUF47 family)
MLPRLFPSERDFFPVFDQTSAIMSESISGLLELMEGKRPSNAIPSALSREDRAQQTARDCINLLHQTFITPFDRSHIFRLLNFKVKIVSLCRLLTEKLTTYDIGDLPLESTEIVLNCGKSCVLVRNAVKQIKHLKKNQDILKSCVEISSLATQNHRLAFNALNHLLNTNNEPRKLVQLQDIQNDLTTITKHFESISFLVEEIILEYA